MASSCASGKTGPSSWKPRRGICARSHRRGTTRRLKGRNVTYEDISLNFLYWPKARIDGSDTVDWVNCWKLRLEPGGQPSSYASVELWVRKADGTFLNGEGYDKSGAMVKRFKVASGQADPLGGWMLKRMRIETLVGGRVKSTTYLEIDK